MSHHERSVSQGLLDAQPGLAAAAARSGSGSCGSSSRWCETAKRDGSRIAADEHRVSCAQTARVQLREQLTVKRRKFRQQEAKLAADAQAAESKLRIDLVRENLQHLAEAADECLRSRFGCREPENSKTFRRRGNKRNGVGHSRSRFR